jgi:single-strand DNA-binding protein
MNESYITVHGYVVNNPVVRTIGDHKVANFRIGVTPRKLERSTGEWRDAETQWYAVSAWRTLADNVAHSLRKGDPVVVQGRLSTRTWINANHAEVVAHEIEATVVGHDLRRGTTHFSKNAPAEPSASAAVESGNSVDHGVDHGPETPTGAPTGASAESSGGDEWNAPLADAPGFAGAA